MWLAAIFRIGYALSKGSHFFIVYVTGVCIFFATGACAYFSHPMLNFLPCCYSLVSILECFQNKTRLMFIRGLPQYKILFSHNVFLFKEVSLLCILSSLHLQNFKHLISFEISINSSYHWLQQSCQVVSNLWRNRLKPKLCHQGLTFWAHPCLHRLVDSWCVWELVV